MYHDENDEDCLAPLCELCGGELQQLGRLGNLLHFRCRYCGILCSVRIGGAR